MIEALTTTDALEAAIVAFLDKAQKRDVSNDRGDGIRSARLIAEAVGMDTKACRDLLRSMSDRGLVKLCEYINGHFWRSTAPLPWEPGGEQHKALTALNEAWKQPLTLVVQAVWSERGQTMSRDIKAYPEALRHLAEDRVRSENWQSDMRYKNDRANASHLSRHYQPPARYRLISLLGVKDGA